MNCWTGEYNDNEKVIKYFKDLIIDSKLIKQYWKDNLKFEEGGDYYGNCNYIKDNHKIIFKSYKSVKLQSYIEFITAIKNNEYIQTWYYNKFNKYFLERKLNKKLQIKNIKIKGNKI